MIICIGWKKGACLGEDGKELPDKSSKNNKGKDLRKNDYSQDDCRNYCLRVFRVTGCEYKKSTKQCIPHLYSVQKATKEKRNTFCSVIFPTGSSFFQAVLL